MRFEVVNVEQLEEDNDVIELITVEVFEHDFNCDGSLFIDVYVSKCDMWFNGGEGYNEYFYTKSDCEKSYISTLVSHNTRHAITSVVAKYYLSRNEDFKLLYTGTYQLKVLEPVNDEIVKRIICDVPIKNDEIYRVYEESIYEKGTSMIKIHKENEYRNEVWLLRTMLNNVADEIYDYVDYEMEDKNV